MTTEKRREQFRKANKKRQQGVKQSGEMWYKRRIKPEWAKLLDMALERIKLTNNP